MRLISCLFLLVFAFPVFAQKMLILEKANRAGTTKMYVGETLRFRLAGAENYWYERQITDILPESNTLLLDNFPVKVADIAAIRVNKKPIVRLLSGALMTFGATLALATTVGLVIYHDKDIKEGALYTASAASFGAGFALSGSRKLSLGKKYRLRTVEISFPAPLIPPPPKGK